MLCFSRAMVVSSTSRVVGIEGNISRARQLRQREPRARLFYIGKRAIGVELFEHGREREPWWLRQVAGGAWPHQWRQIAIDRLAHLDARAVDTRMHPWLGARRA